MNLLPYLESCVKIHIACPLIWPTLCTNFGLEYVVGIFRDLAKLIEDAQPFHSHSNNLLSSKKEMTFTVYYFVLIELERL